MPSHTIRTRPRTFRTMIHPVFALVNQLPFSPGWHDDGTITKARFAIFRGTRGYSSPAWKGSFYSEKLPQKQMLISYAERFGTVEANCKFLQLAAAGCVSESDRRQGAVHPSG